MRSTQGLVTGIKNKIIIETKVSIVNGSREKVNILEFREGFWSMRFK